jgi:hypothetical protein
MYTIFNAGNKEYKLRLNTRNVVLLEKQLGSNPLSIFGTDLDNPTIPTITVMVNILHASLQQFQHNITLNDAFDIFDEWLADGHVSTEFIPLILEIYKASGIIADESGQGEKN